MNKKVYIYVAQRVTKAYGVRVIVDQMKNLFDDVEVIDSLENLQGDSIVVPYGLLASVSLWRNGKFNLGLALMVDAYTLGIRSELKYFYNKKYVSKRFLVIHFLKYIKYWFYEFIILKYYKNVMLVSVNDLLYYQQNKLTNKYASKIVIVPNGINVIPNRHPYRRPDTRKIRVGCLSNWSTMTYYTLKDFMLNVWKKADTSQMVLIIAGRYLTPSMCLELESFENVRVIGEVKDLSEFYDQIDASLITMVKECGIINRILDGFVYRVPVISRPQSLLAFKELPDCCFSYNDAESFERVIHEIKYSFDNTMEKTEIAIDFVQKHHDWNTNYRLLKDIILKQ